MKKCIFISFGDVLWHSNQYIEDSQIGFFVINI